MQSPVTSLHAYTRTDAEVDGSWMSSMPLDIMSMQKTTWDRLPVLSPSVVQEQRRRMGTRSETMERVTDAEGNRFEMRCLAQDLTGALPVYCRDLIVKGIVHSRNRKSQAAGIDEASGPVKKHCSTAINELIGNDCGWYKTNIDCRPSKSQTRLSSRSLAPRLDQEDVAFLRDLVVTAQHKQLERLSTSRQKSSSPRRMPSLLPCLSPSMIGAYLSAIGRGLFASWQVVILQNQVIATYIAGFRAS
ncbi:MAG TPA: hypothetical protein V6D17_16835 [Candidatus Obscuribacterales bacterium]